MISFEFYRVRLSFRARGRLRFPAPASNLLRGALGDWLRAAEDADAEAGDAARWFRPGVRPGLPPLASGLADWPRPFVLRASHLDGAERLPGESWSFDVHLFARGAVRPLVRALAGAARRGMGRSRAASDLAAIATLDLDGAAHPSPPGAPPGEDALPGPANRLDLGPTGERAGGVRLGFVTPTELKGPVSASSEREPDFATLFARLRDRLGNLSALYGPGPLPVDFRALGERARSIRLREARIHWERAERRSSRTGQVHPLGGFTGEADYEGELGEFLPWLRAARWVGVGRQTVWGKGDVRVLGWHQSRV